MQWRDIFNPLELTVLVSILALAVLMIKALLP